MPTILHWKRMAQKVAIAGELTSVCPFNRVGLDCSHDTLSYEGLYKVKHAKEKLFWYLPLSTSARNSKHYFLSLID